MHVLMVTETYPPEINGVALTVQCLLENLRRLGHRVTLVRPRQPTDVGATSTELDEILVSGVPIPRYPGLKFGLPARGRLCRVIAERRIDALYVATEGPLGWSAVSAARAMAVPVACGFHTRFDDYFRHYGAAFLERAARAWMRRFHNRASCTLVPTGALKQELIASGFAHVELLRRAVDTERFNPRHRDLALRRQLGVPACAPLVLHVGRLAPEKNLDLVTAAFERVQALSPGARMLWIGDGPARAELERRHPRHRFVGVLRGAELARHYASADLFLFPSLTETFGNVTLEALASGLTVCAFDYAAAHEHIQSGVSGELTPVARAAGAWLKGKRLGEAGRDAVEHLSPLRVAEDFVELMNTLIASARRAKPLQENPDVALHSPTV